MAEQIAVYLEVAPKRTFAVAVDWPGWTRGGRTEGDALAALVAYGPRYTRAVGPAAGFEAPAEVAELEVVERLAGGSGTEFGVPGAIPALDERALEGPELERQQAIFVSAWEALLAAAAAADERLLRKGPRGGGRDLPTILDHAMEAEIAYLGQLGARYRRDGSAPLEAEIGRLRAAEEAALVARATGVPIAEPRATHSPWPPRYFVRRSAWHLLDHAWEIEDRVEPA